MPGRGSRTSTVQDWVRHDERQEQTIQTVLQDAQVRLSGITTTAEQGKPSPLEEFVDRCLSAAREELRSKDPTFVAQAEAQLRLEKTGLHSYESVLDTAPRARLRKHWHELMEACYDLPSHFWNVRIAASGLDAKNFAGLSHEDAYRRGNFYRTSLSVSLQALAEHAGYMIECVTRAYLPALSEPQRKKIYGLYKKRVCELFKGIAEGRNKLLHAGRRSATADAITERDFWEYIVVAGDTNPFRASRYPLEERAGNFRSGKWACLQKLADHFCDLLGQVLLDLEDALTQRVAKRSTANASDGTQFAVAVDAKPITNEDVHRALDG